MREEWEGVMTANTAQILERKAKASCPARPWKGSSWQRVSEGEAARGDLRSGGCDIGGGGLGGTRVKRLE